MGRGPRERLFAVLDRGTSSGSASLTEKYQLIVFLARIR